MGGEGDTTMKVTSGKDKRMVWLRKQYAGSGGSYFSNSAVKSSKGFMQTAGTILAIPYSTGAPKRARSQGGFPGVPPKEGIIETGASEYQKQFQEKRFEYSSMDRKPLTAYDPLAYRSRNAIADVTMPYKNSSVVDECLDQGLHVCRKRQYCTTSQNAYKGLPCETRTNPGILAMNYAKAEFFRNL